MVRPSSGLGIVGRGHQFTLVALFIKVRRSTDDFVLIGRFRVEMRMLDRFRRWSDETPTIIDVGS